MFYQTLRSFLGSFTVILDFFAARPEWITAFFCVYLGMYASGKMQLSGIKRRTQKLIEEKCKSWLSLHPEATDEMLYAYFYPIWEAELNQMGYRFILNKYDFWPVSVTPQHVLAKIHLTPPYLRKYLEGTKIAEISDRERIFAARVGRKQTNLKEK